MTVNELTAFVIENKFWLAVLAPFVIGFVVLKIVG